MDSSKITREQFHQVIPSFIFKEIMRQVYLLNPELIFFIGYLIDKDNFTIEQKTIKQMAIDLCFDERTIKRNKSKLLELELVDKNNKPNYEKIIKDKINFDTTRGTSTSPSTRIKKRKCCTQRDIRDTPKDDLCCTQRDIRDTPKVTWASPHFDKKGHGRHPEIAETSATIEEKASGISINNINKKKAYIPSNEKHCVKNNRFSLEK